MSQINDFSKTAFDWIRDNFKKCINGEKCMRLNGPLCKEMSECGINCDDSSCPTSVKGKTLKLNAVTDLWFLNLLTQS